MVGVLFAPLSWVKEIWEILSISIFGIPLWIFVFLGLFFFIPRVKKKIISEKSTNQKIMEGVVTAAVASKLFKKPELSFDDSSINIVKDPKGFFGESICPSGLHQWEYIVSGNQGGREVTQKNRIDTTTVSGNFDFYGKNIYFTAKWVAFSLDEVPEKYKKLFQGFL